MQLIHQIGSVKIGEVVRYTVTYTPSQDRILPSPEKLYLRIRNTSAIALRAAFVHGPYNLCVAAYPASYNPNRKFNNPRRYGVPEFEPMVKAGGSWQCELVVPEHIRQSAGIGGGGQHFGGAPSDPAGAPDGETLSASWIVEVSSQVIFSTSAAVGYEIVLARDEKSLSLSSALPVIGGQAQVPQPGKVGDHQHEPGYREPAGGPLSKGVFSRAIRLKVEDTATLWNTPRLPGWEHSVKQASGTGSDGKTEKVQLASNPPLEAKEQKRPQKKVHLVVLTHGLHSNLGADMLYLKESIDATVKQAKVDAKKRRAQERADRKAKEAAAASTAESSVPNGDGDGEGSPPADGSAETPAAADPSVESEHSDDDEDDEEVIVRGFSGNATRTERGIKFLGKRLARYVLSTCYPDQPYLPSIKGAAADGLAAAVKHNEGKPVHKNSSIHRDEVDTQRPFRITSISFIGHSLGGLVQTYAVAYIQKHSPEFFDLIKPINFVAMATPFLGLSNENPLYVKFALDFGLVGRTGQDLGLTWRAPTIARSGWGAIVSNLGESAHKRVVGESRPESKPLLRILPTGPAHTALKKFRNRTTYSNVVNDGIVPLRTSCLLFLDWQGLGRVEKARRDAGLVETLVGAGWAELTGANVTGARRDQRQLPEDDEDEDHDGDDESGVATPKPTDPENAAEVPQPSENAIIDDDKVSLRSVGTPYAENGHTAPPTPSSGPFSGFFNLFKSNEPHQPQPQTQLSPKQNKIYRRSQTIKLDDDAATASSSSVGSKVTTGQEFENETDGLNAPPRTTFFESAHDLINPTLPSTDFILDPSKRPRAIFHDRVYHPSDIPPPPLKKRSTGSASGTLSLRRRNTNASTATTATNASSNTDAKDHTNDTAASSPFPSQDVDRQDSTLSTRDYDDTPNTNPGKAADEEIDGSQMRVEEKIARAYHRGIAWRKVLVKVEPDAHNNIIVRRMFANAFGWPVVKHMVDAHFSDAATARTRVDEEGNEERALDISQPPDKYGGEIKFKKGEASGRESHKETTAQRGARKEQAEQKKDAVNGLRVDTSRSDSLTREAEDKVSDLPHVDSSPARAGSSGSGSSPSRARPAPRQQVFRHDSMTWSDGDWIDTDDDDHSDNGTKSPRFPSSPSQPGFPASAMLSPSSAAGPSGGSGGGGSGGWNWTEKIVGRSSSKRATAREGSGVSSISTTSSADRGGETQQPQTPTTPTLTVGRPRNDSLGVD
ncbi:revertant of glycogen synthase kinase mutation [Plectosphaerella cucumerina]|uniref:Revertant of glycogen synthase kinase mutation n=1 Tax=Plectosphaerella cucumerina TaxID=40658 RepID=A0A8K0TRL6_9PEZI|nr:revertant of glycogen synthase kinase mutation [Plectosphaerella cucumerina]